MEKRLLTAQYGMLVAFVCGSLVVAIQEVIKPKLTGAIIRWLDNKPLALDCAAMGDILHVRRELRKMQCGVQDPVTKQFVGFYQCENQMRTLRWLAEYEGALEAALHEQKIALEKKYMDYNAFLNEWKSIKTTLDKDYERDYNEQQENLTRRVKDEEEHDYETIKLQRKLNKEQEHTNYQKEDEIKKKYIQNKQAFDKELDALIAQHKQKLTELEICLTCAKRDFVKANAPFTTKMEGTKQMLLKLIQEFCLKFRRPYSFLLEWADADDGQGFVVFEKNMVNCRALNLFITDLVDFLEALYYACDKARTEFEAKQKGKVK